MRRRRREPRRPQGRHSVRGSMRVDALRTEVSLEWAKKRTSVHDHVLAHANPPHPSSEKGRKVHAPHRVPSNISSHRMPHPQVVPDRLANHVVLPEVLAKRREPSLPVSQLVTLASFTLLGRRALEVRLAVQARLARHAGSDGEVVDSEVHLGVRRAEEDLFDARAEVRVGVDGEREVVDETDWARGRGGRSGEEGDGAGEGTGGGKDVRVEDPENIVRCESVGTDQVVDLGVHANVLIACEKSAPARVPPLNERTDDELRRDLRVLVHQSVHDWNRCVVLERNGEDDVELGVVLEEGRLEVLVQVAVEAAEWA